MRMQDQELKRELDQIFSDEKEDDLSYESDVKAITETSRSAGLDLQAIVKLLRANTADELILISVLKTYAVQENVMYASFVISSTSCQLPSVERTCWRRRIPPTYMSILLR